MPLNVFFTLCILGIDFMVYVLFQWTYGDKRRKIARKITAIRNSPEPLPSRPFLVTSKRPPFLDQFFAPPSQPETSHTARFLQST
jgi:hypothetical protein